MQLGVSGEAAVCRRHCGSTSAAVIDTVMTLSRYINVHCWARANARALCHPSKPSNVFPKCLGSELLWKMWSPYLFDVFMGKVACVLFLITTRKRVETRYHDNQLQPNDRLETQNCHLHLCQIRLETDVRLL